MDVKGTAFLARKSQVVAMCGEERWRSFLGRLAASRPVFGQPVTALTRIPLADFLAFQEAAVTELFDGDPQAYWIMGEKSAEWALRDGPYKVFLTDKSVEQFVEVSLPSIWKAYYTEGRIDILREGRILNIKVLDVPIPHVYFEYLVMGYLKRSFELLGVKDCTPRRIRGVSAGDAEIHYQFEVPLPRA